MKDRILQEDIEKVINSDIPFHELKERTVLITGATGLVGVQLIRVLLAVDLGIKIVALIRDEEKAKAIFGNDIDKLILLRGDIVNEVSYSDEIDYIFHCASVTTSKDMVNKPVETIMTSVMGTRNLLTLAKVKKVKAFVYISSMEMYGTFEERNHDVKETDLGYIDLLKVRSNYPESKRLCENMCIAFFKEYGVPVKIARLAQTFGAGVLPGENRVFAQFARSAIRGEDIVLHTKGLSEGNYCYTRDTISALLILLINGVVGEAYNISNPNAHSTIADMANIVCQKITKNKIKVVYDIPESNDFGYAADIKMKLNSDKMQALGWKPEVGLEEAYLRLIGSLKDTGDY